MPTLPQAVLLVLALAAVGGVVLGVVRHGGIAILALVAARFAVALAAFCVAAALLAGMAVVVAAWFARAIGHGEKTTAGDLGLAAATFVPLLVASALAWYGAGRLRRRLDRQDS